MHKIEKYTNETKKTTPQTLEYTSQNNPGLVVSYRYLRHTARIRRFEIYSFIHSCTKYSKSIKSLTYKLAINTVAYCVYLCMCVSLEIQRIIRTRADRWLLLLNFNCINTGRIADSCCTPHITRTLFTLGYNDSFCCLKMQNQKKAGSKKLKILTNYKFYSYEAPCVMLSWRCGSVVRTLVVGLSLICAWSCVRYGQPTRSTQPSIPPGSVNE